MHNILLVDDHVLVRDGLELILQSEADFKVAAVAPSGSEAMTILASTQNISLLILDLKRPGTDGLEFISSVKKDFPAIPIVVISVLDDQNTIDTALNCGATSYISKLSDSSELIFAIRRALAGKMYLCSYLTKRMVNRSKDADDNPRMKAPLTPREREVLKMVASGLTNLEIADRLFASRRTVEGYRQKLLNKTGTKNTATLIRFAIQYNMVG